jgi:putative ABC transport system substrate-binding protein
MRRREFMTVVAGAAAFVSDSVWAQQSQPPLIGVLEGASAATMAVRYDTFRTRLREFGYVEGVNIRIEYRYATVSSIAFPPWRRS